ncbi:MAG: helix-turn-helix domain-containing protein [Clostridia bacterium]|nr:helix-turn-helix domain-containing protein [Clostridia bacterium]
MITLEQIQKRLAEVIKQSGMSQTTIAKALNITQSNISHYLKGDKMPALDTLANLCKLLDIDTNYILCQ